MLDPDRDKCRPSKVKGLSHTGLLVMRTCTRTSWQGSRDQGKEQRALLSRAETYRDKESSCYGPISGTTFSMNLSLFSSSYLILSYCFRL